MTCSRPHTAFHGWEGIWTQAKPGFNSNPHPTTQFQLNVSNTQQEPRAGKALWHFRLDFDSTMPGGVGSILDFCMVKGCFGAPRSSSVVLIIQSICHCLLNSMYSLLSKKQLRSSFSRAGLACRYGRDWVSAGPTTVPSFSLLNRVFMKSRGSKRQFSFCTFLLGMGMNCFVMVWFGFTHKLNRYTSSCTKLFK